MDWCIESAGLLSEFDLLSSSQDFNPAAAIADIDRFLDENPPPSAENQQNLIELAEVTENHWAKQNALFAYNRVMEISERFSYHSQILETMVANGGHRGKQSSGIGLPRVPVASTTVAAPVESGKVEEDGQGGNPPVSHQSRVDGPNGVDSRGSSPVLSDSDDQTDAASARTKSLRYRSNHFQTMCWIMISFIVHSLLSLSLSLSPHTGQYVHTKTEENLKRNYT